MYTYIYKYNYKYKSDHSLALPLPNGRGNQEVVERRDSPAGGSLMEPCWRGEERDVDRGLGGLRGG